MSENIAKLGLVNEQSKQNKIVIQVTKQVS